MKALTKNQNPKSSKKLPFNLVLGFAPGLLIWAVLFSQGAVAQDIYIQTGRASFYADKFEGRATASGEKYRHSKLTAAHLTLPFGTKVKVTNLDNQKSVVVKVNDRGPFVEGRVIDLSKSAAELLDFVTAGLADVQLEIVKVVVDKGGNAGKPVQSDAHIVDPKEYYKFEATRVALSGYGIQIGSFVELANVMRVAENLKSKYRKQVTVQVADINKVKYYKIIVGNFPSRTKAEPQKAKVIRDYPDCFIVKFEE
jgi:rare lipoprotein A